MHIYSSIIYKSLFSDIILCSHAVVVTLLVLPHVTLLTCYHTFCLFISTVFDIFSLHVFSKLIVQASHNLNAGN